MYTTFGYILAVFFIGFGLLCFLNRDMMWQLEYRVRKLRGYSGEELERDAQFEREFDVTGRMMIFWGIVVLAVAILR